MGCCLARILKWVIVLALVGYVAFIAANVAWYRSHPGTEPPWSALLPDDLLRRPEA